MGGTVDPAGEGRAEKAATSKETLMEIATTAIPAIRGRGEDLGEAAKMDEAPDVGTMRDDREDGKRNPKTTRRSKP